MGAQHSNLADGYTSQKQQRPQKRALLLQVEVITHWPANGRTCG